jgi:small-conductance mechanosensitive channel
LIGQPENQGRVQRIQPGEPAPLAASEIAAEAEETTAFLNAAIQASQPRSAVVSIEAALPQLREKTLRLVEKTEDELDSNTSLTGFSDLKNSLGRQDRLLRDMRDQIREESGRLDGNLEQIRRRRAVWNLTKEVARSGDYPDAVVTVIGRTLSELEEGREAIGERRSHLLALQNSIVEMRGLINEGVNRVTAAEETRLSRLFSFNGPPLWDVYQIDAGDMLSRFRDQIGRTLSSLIEYVSAETQWIILNVLLLLILTLLLRTARSRLERNLADREDLAGARQVLEHPFTSSILVTVFLSSIFSPSAPHAWYNLLLLLALIALLRLIPGFVPGPLVTSALLLLGLRTFELINSQIPEGTPLSRLLFSLTLLSTLIALFLFKSRVSSATDISRRWRRVLAAACWAGILVLAVALLSGILGNVALSGLLTSGTVKSAFLALAYWLAFTIAREMFVLGLDSQLLLGSSLIRNNRHLLLRKATRIAGVLTCLAFIASVPYLFSFYDPLRSAITAAFTRPLEAGTLSLSLADVFAFVFLVWLSFQISRLICFVLDEDVLPRFTLPGGVPATISRLTHYAIVFLGFVIALAAAGFDLSRLTLLAGAFGVGIGFGLQNIVNNFVSGLIILFERPVRVGDKIELRQDLTGEVTRIGIRASVVKTVDGADVLVPNGNLISNELTNWTLSDRKRRIVIPVGVAYGTKPRKVLDILEGLASAHPEVLRVPEPAVFFMGFGESSLNFSLRVWVGHFERGFQVSSDLAVAIQEALEEAGIEIPFPQRVVHFGSIPSELQVAPMSRQREPVDSPAGTAPGSDGEKPPTPAV